MDQLVQYRAVTPSARLSKPRPVSGVHLGLYADDTAALCHWHIPEAHFLKAWSDARAFDGTASIIQPLIDFLDQIDAEHNDGQLATVILPEFVPARWWESIMHNQTAWMLKAALLYRRRERGFQRVIIDIPYHLRK